MPGVEQRFGVGDSLRGRATGRLADIFVGLRPGGTGAFARSNGHVFPSKDQIHQRRHIGEDDDENEQRRRQLRTTRTHRVPA